MICIGLSYIPVALSVKIRVHTVVAMRARGHDTLYTSARN